MEQATKQERLKSAEAVDNATSQVAGDDGCEFCFLSWVAPEGEVVEVCELCKGIWDSEADVSAKQTYVGAIVSKIVDNVQIHVKGIHVRYEDGTNTPDVSLLVGHSGA